MSPFLFQVCVKLNTDNIHHHSGLEPISPVTWCETMQFITVLTYREAGTLTFQCNQFHQFSQTNSYHLFPNLNINAANVFFF